MGYRYEIGNSRGATGSATPEQIAEIEAAGLTFQDAMDLPDNVEFARWGVDDNGKAVFVYRTDDSGYREEQ